MIRSVLICLLLSVFLPLPAQEGMPPHTFTDKSGKQVTASLLSLSGDRRKMKIRREDGQEFELVINVLSLDDQQFIKEHLDSIPVEKTEFRLEMDVALKEVSSESQAYRETSYLLTRNLFTYLLKVNNLSRETLEDAKIEWAVALDDRLRVRPADEGEPGWTYDRYGDGEVNMVALTGSVALPSVPFNQEIVTTSGEIVLDEMTYDGEVYAGREDTVIGAIFRIVGPDGSVLLEKRIGDADFEEMSWDETVALVVPARE